MEEMDYSGSHQQAADWFLKILVGHANEGLEVPVTLCVGGILISGRLISQRKYFEGIAERISHNSPQAEALAKSFAQIPDHLRDAAARSDPEEAEYLEEEAAARYVHLAEAQSLSPGYEVPSAQGPFWRGRTDSVDGFWLGSAEYRE